MRPGYREDVKRILVEKLRKNAMVEDDSQEDGMRYLTAKEVNATAETLLSKHEGVVKEWGGQGANASQPASCIFQRHTGRY